MLLLGAVCLKRPWQGIHRLSERWRLCPKEVQLGSPEVERLHNCLDQFPMLDAVAAAGEELYSGQRGEAQEEERMLPGESRTTPWSRC